jgi:CxxC motif-containing protein (DUF1111 family)
MRTRHRRRRRPERRAVDANKLRTPPLWGSRTHDRHMHDGLSVTFTDAILRHGNEAQAVINRFRNLSSTQRAQIVTFLQSL